MCESRIRSGVQKKKKTRNKSEVMKLHGVVKYTEEEAKKKVIEPQIIQDAQRVPPLVDHSETPGGGQQS